MKSRIRKDNFGMWEVTTPKVIGTGTWTRRFEGFREATAHASLMARSLQLLAEHVSTSNGTRYVNPRVLKTMKKNEETR